VSLLGTNQSRSSDDLVSVGSQRVLSSTPVLLSLGSMSDLQNATHRCHTFNYLLHNTEPSLACPSLLGSAIIWHSHTNSCVILRVSQSATTWFSATNFAYLCH
jgi:hypothetical protein